ncbi:MAG: hypothetical protein D6707_11970 [Bacteroidetes bacterium]|nr:MAG: hypothetical protein D6707_11970 [Bacteroidota bacterium]
MRNFIPVILISLITSYGHSQNDFSVNFENANIVGELNHWCSDKQAYKAEELPEPQPVNSCYGKAHYYGHWFKFQASRPTVEIILKTGEEEGTLRFPYVSLFDKNFKQLTCKAYTDEFDDLVINYENLTPGEWYLISVNCHNNSSYVGTFTLCVNSELSYDTKEGALKIESTSNYCTVDTFTTEGATPHPPKASCLKNGPNFNRWFYFIAQTPKIEVSVYPTNHSGNFQFPYLALFDENFRELDCSKYINDEEPIAVESKNLIPGKKYYVSVDHQFNPKYQGSFRLCFSDGTVNNTYQLMGRLTKDGKPLKKEQVAVYSQKDNHLIGNSVTDDRGKFKFIKLPKEESFYIEAPYESEVEMYLVDEFGEVLGQCKQVHKEKSTISPLDEKCNKISIMDCNPKNISIQEGKTGVYGRIVDKFDLFEGVKDVKVSLYDRYKQKIKETKSDEKGEFVFKDLAPSAFYSVHLTPNGQNYHTEIVYFNDKGNVLMTSTNKNMDENGFFHFVKLPAIEDKLELMDEEDGILKISEIEENKPLRLQNIYFASNSSELIPTSYAELNVLVKYLKTHPEKKIKITGHTDSKGNADFNLKLSIERAKSVAEYLMQQGIDKTRISYTGKGNTRPIADNTTKEGRAKNRRVEFEIYQ